MWTSHIQDYKDIFLQTKVCAYWARKSVLRYYCESDHVLNMVYNFLMRYIQELLGHKSSKTTEIYTHVSNKDIRKIKSPVDTLKQR